MSWPPQALYSMNRTTKDTNGQIGRAETFSLGLIRTHPVINLEKIYIMKAPSVCALPMHGRLHVIPETVVHLEH